VTLTFELLNYLRPHLLQHRSCL